MHFLDLCGSPGSGKSTLADQLWGPHAIPIEDRLPPASWHDWVNEISRLFHLIRKHPTLPAAVRMVNRSVRKIATVARMFQGEPIYDKNGRVLTRSVAETVGPYIQTALAQRGLGFGWRIVDLGIDINELRHYFRLMPVSIGVAVTRCPQHIVEARNHARRLVRETQHEDRSRMVGLMQPAIELAIEVLRERNVPLLEVDTTQPIDDARAQLLAFANRPPCDAAQMGSGNQEEPLRSSPPWWVS